MRGPPCSDSITARRSAARRTCSACQAPQAPAAGASEPQPARYVARRHALACVPGVVALFTAGRAAAAMQLPGKETVDAESAYIQGASTASTRCPSDCMRTPLQSGTAIPLADMYML